MPARTPAPFDLSSLETALPKIFDQAQNTTANHQKNFIALYKLQSEAASIKVPVQNGKSFNLRGEKAFQNAYDDVLLRVLPNKKGVTVADRVVRFMAGYTKFLAEKIGEERAKEHLEEDEETTTERFFAHVLSFLLQGVGAKEKNVRYRVCQFLAETIIYMNDIDEDLYTSLREALVERLQDNEANVRAQAVAALAKLSFSEDVNELEEGEPSIVSLILKIMTCDESAEVRRTALHAIPLNSVVLPQVLERTRDVDPSIRKAVYTNIVEKYCMLEERTIGFTHPKVLSIDQRELIVKNGLGDREPSVRAATAQLLVLWFELTSLHDEEDTVKEETVEKTIDDLVAFSDLFDLTDGGAVAQDALGSLFDSRMDIYENLEIPESFWANITPHRAFVARVFIDKCKEKDKDSTKAEAQLPVTTAMAFRVQDAYNALVEFYREEEERAKARGNDEDNEDNDEDENDAARETRKEELTVILGELLRAAANCDYGDEIGRRKMFLTVRGTLTAHILPEKLIPYALDIIRELSPNEQDLIRVVVEIVHGLRDPPDEEEGQSRLEEDDSMTETGTPRRPRPAKPPVELTPEQVQRSDEVDMRCLSLCIGMLERINGTFEENIMLEGILSELIVPAVKRRDMNIREKGLISLGLCCLIYRRMAIGSFQLFLNQVATAPEVLKLRVVQIIFDILMVHENDFLGQSSANGPQIIDFILSLLENEELDSVQALLCLGISKLMLAGMVSDERVLRTLVLVYCSPDTSDNQELKQCLAYFFPVYSYSSSANQRRMRDIFIPVFEKVAEAHHESKDVGSPLKLSQMFVVWTDPIRAKEAVKHLRPDAENDPIQLEFAADIIKMLFDTHYNKEDKKMLCQMLGKLYMPDNVDDDKIRVLKLLVSNLRSRRPPRDATAKNALAKFDAALEKKYQRQLENFSEDELRKLEELRDMFEFLDDIIPLEEDDDEPPVPRGNKRRSMSEVTSTTSGTSRGDSPPPSHRRNKRRRTGSDGYGEDDDDDNERRSPSVAPAPTRAMPKRNAAVKSKAATTAALKKPIQISDDEEDEDEESGQDDDEEEEERAPTPKPRGKPGRRGPPPKAPKLTSSRARQAAQIDEDIDNMLDGNVTKDSIMDPASSASDEDEDDDEVEHIL